MLTTAQKDSFALEGWLRVPGLICSDELEALRAETAALITHGHPDRSSDPTFQYGPDPNEPCRVSFFRVNDLLTAHALPRVRLLLGHSGLLDAVGELFGGAPFASTTETLVFKLPGHGFGHRWHQDPPHIRRFPSIMAGVYLDRSTACNGALCVMPRSHLSGYFGTEDWVFDLTGGPFEVPATAVTVEAEPGDVVFHATTVVHGSPWNDAPQIRRTVYFQFDHYEDVRQQSPDFWTRKRYLEGQSRLLDAVAARRAAFPDETHYTPRTIRPEQLP